MAKYKVWLDDNGQISEKSVMHPIDGTEVKGMFHPTTDMIAAMRPVDDEEIKAWDPETNTVIDFRASDTPRIARMRHAMAQDSYKALKKGFFGAEYVDENDNWAFNATREFARNIARPVMNAGQNYELMFGDVENTVILDLDEGTLQPYRDVLVQQIQENNQVLNNALGVQRDGLASEFGGAVGSLGSIVGASVLGGHIGATMAIANMSLESGANAYMEGLAGGLDDDEAWNRGAAVGAANAALERIGIGLLWKSAGKKIVNRVVRGFITEGSEEASQNISEDVIMNKVRGKSIEDVLLDAARAGLIGGIIGSAAGTIAGGNIKGLQQVKKELVERGLTEQQADALIEQTNAAFSDKQARTNVVAEVLQEQIDNAKWPNENFADAVPVLKTIAEDAIAAARNDVDIRQTIKDRTVGVDTQTQEIVADSVQAFADKIADDFGITQREFVDKTGLTVQTESGDTVAQTFADGTQINENGEFVDENGNVLFQRIGKRGARKEELDALDMALQLEALGYDNDSIKKSTGWARGLDDMMWLEKDGAYSVNVDGVEKLVKSQTKTALLRDIVNTENFARYPQLQNVEIHFVYDSKSRSRGHWDKKNNRVQINVAQMLNSNVKPGVQVIKTLAHEIDHAIADIEGFESGSRISEKALKQQVKRHKQRMIKALRELGLYDKYVNNLEQQGKRKSHFDAVLDAILDTYTVEDVNQALNKKLDRLQADAIIVDRYGEETLKELDVKEREARIREAYTQTIGERYARRAAELAVSGQDDSAIRNTPDERATNAEFGLLSPRGTEIDARIGEIVWNELAAGLNTQPEQTRFNQSGDVRGYFDWTNKMQQVIQIMKTGDLDTVMHELGHFFSVNYIHMAIESGKLDNIRPLMEYYQVQNPRELIVREDIQEDLAVKFLTYLKTDESPRGFRKYFDAVRDWLAAAWEKLRGSGLVQDGDLPDEIVRFFDSITIVKPKNLNLDRIAASKEQLRGVLKKAKNGTLEDVSDQQLHDIEQLLKAARARIPRMPKSLYSKLWGSLNTRFAETHDLAALMGIDDKIKHLATRKSGGIANENDLMDFLREEGLMFGDSWDNNAGQDSQAWDDALRIIANARNEYSIDDVARIEEINQLTQAKEDALDILGNIDPYDALATIEAAKKTRNQELRAEERTAKMQLKTLESDYKRIKTQNLRLQAKNLEAKSAFKSAVNFLYAQDLPTDTKARFLRKLNKVYDMRTLGKWMQEVREKAHRMYSEAANRAQRERLSNELKETFARNKRNIKYDYEHNKLFNDLRRYNRMSVNDAIAEIQQFYTDTDNPTPLSREDELRKMMLHYRTQRGGMGGMSTAFMDELISRVQEAKLIGRDAIDEIQFERGVNRIQAQEDVLDAIATNKNPNALQRGYLRVIGNLKSTIDAITNSVMADKFDMVEKEIKASIAGKKRINETLDEIAKMNELPHGRNQLWEYKQELLKPIEGLRVWYVDHGGKKVWYDEKGFSRGQIMSMWNLYKDKDSHQLMDKFYTENQIHQLFGYLTEADKRTADLMMDRLGDIYDMVNPVYVKVWQRDMPHRLNYWPRQSAHEQDHELIETFDGTRQEANFTKSRSHGAVPVFYKDALSIYEAHEMDAQYMVHQALAYKELADTFSHTTVQQAIRNKFGSKVLETLNDHIKAVSIGGVRKSRNAVTDTITKYVGQYTVAKIALNPSVLGGQLSAYHAYSNNMPTATYYKDLAYAIGHMRETHKFMKKYVGDYLENRISGGFNETLKAMMDYDKAGAKRAKLNEFLTSWVRNADYASIVWGGYPRLKFLLEEKAANGEPARSQDAAVRQWITETEETMQSHTQASLSQMQRQGGWNSLFTTFKNQQSQYMRKIFDAWFEFGRGEISSKQFGKTIANYLVIQSALFAILRWSVRAAIGITGDDEEPMENVIDAIVQGAIDPIPIVNEIGNMAMQQLKDGKTYGAKIQLLGVDDGMRAVEKALKLMTSESARDRADWHDYTSVMAPFIEMTTSLPVSQYNRILEKWGL